MYIFNYDGEVANEALKDNVFSKCQWSKILINEWSKIKWSVRLVTELDVQSTIRS